MTRMTSPARLLPAAGFALLCLVLALGYASAQTTPTAPTIDSVSSGDTTLTVTWTAPTGITTGVAAYDVRYIETGEDETVDSNWTVEEDAWEDGGGSLTYAVTGLTNGTEYDVQARAVDVNDVDGVWSATTSATPADHGNTRIDATSVTAGASVWGAIDPADDEDYVSFSVSRTADYWIYTLGDLDTVGELLDSNDMPIESDDYGAVLPNPDNFFLWYRLQSGTYYIKVTGFGPTDEPYILRVREFTDTTSRSNAATLNLNVFAGGTIEPEDDDDYFKLELSAATEVAIRASGFPDTVGELQRSNGTVIASNDDGYLPGGRRNFLIRENLAAGAQPNLSAHRTRSSKGLRSCSRPSALRRSYSTCFTAVCPGTRPKKASDFSPRKFFRKCRPWPHQSTPGPWSNRYPGVSSPLGNLNPGRCDGRIASSSPGWSVPLM